jgi:hypothetical protein
MYRSGFFYSKFETNQSLWAKKLASHTVHPAKI